MVNLRIVSLLALAALGVGLPASPAAAQITNGQTWPLAPGNAYRNNVAFDPVHQVYLVIVKRPLVTGRFYDRHGNQIGADFVIADEPGFTAWASVAAGGPPNDPAFLVTYVIAQDPNPKYGRLVRFVPGSAPSVGPARWITDVTSEWIYAEKAQNVWNGQRFIVGSRVRYPGAMFPTFQVNHFDLNGWVSGPVDLGDGQDYYGSPALSCATNGVCLAIGYMAGVPTGYSGGSYARRFDGATLQPIGPQFTLATGTPNEDQGVVYQAHLGRFLTQWFRGGGEGYIDTRIVNTDGSMSPLDPSRGIGPQAGTNAAAYNAFTRSTLLLTKSVAATLYAVELGDDGYPKSPNWLMQTPWDWQVLDYLPSIAADPSTGRWLVTWELQSGGYARLIQGTATGGGSNPVQNGDFSHGLSGWTPVGIPTPGDIVAGVSAGVLEFYRQPSGGTNSAAVLQALGQGVGAGVSIAAQFDLGNSSSARKRVTVILHDLDFSDLQFCTFWLAPGAPLRTYVMRTFTTKAWSNATISFYAATEGSDGGAYRVDNVSASLTAGFPADRTDCVDPTAPAPPGGGDGPELMSNGTFSTFLLGWQLYGQISANVSGGVFQFVRPPGSPAGSLLQATGTALPAGSPLTATFDLGNSSSVRKRVTVLVHDLNYSDLQGCSFWLAPGQPLTTYRIRTFLAHAPANASISFYLGNVDTNEWARLDNVSLKRTPGTTVVGTECTLAGGTPNASTLPDAPSDSTSGPAPTFPAPSPGAPPSSPIVPREVSPSLVMLSADPVLTAIDLSAWMATGSFMPIVLPDGDRLLWISAVAPGETGVLAWATPVDLRGAGSASLQFLSRRADDAAIAELQVSGDGLTWTTLGALAATAGAWTIVDIDLHEYLGQVVFVRFVHAAGAAGAGTAEWAIARVSIVRGLK